jgi:hypothetical protein
MRLVCEAKRSYRFRTANMYLESTLRRNRIFVSHYLRQGG